MRTLLLISALATTLYAQSPFALKPNDRVVFFGDSITDQRLYTTFAETYVVTRFPQSNITFTHSGWGGDRVSGGSGGPVDVRLWRDVLPYNPTVVTIMLGMNDARYRAFDQTIFDDFDKGMRHIVAILKRQLPSASITLIQPSPYDDVTRAPLFEGGYNNVLRRYSDFLKDLATTEKLQVADLNTSVVAALTKANTLNPADAAKLIPDRVHPGPAGHLLMAKALLEDWHAPALVSEVEIEASRKSVSVQRNTRITELTSSAKSISWLQLDQSLPMPVDAKDPLTALAVQSSNFHEALNRQSLKLARLTPGTYTLTIDAQPVGGFTAEQLASGINLATLPTPMLQQAARVHALTLQHTAIHNLRWRQVQVPLEKTNTPELLNALKALDELEATIVKEQRATAQPLPRRYELTLN